MKYCPKCKKQYPKYADDCTKCNVKLIEMPFSDIYNSQADTNSNGGNQRGNNSRRMNQATGNPTRPNQNLNQNPNMNLNQNQNQKPNSRMSKNSNQHPNDNNFMGMNQTGSIPLGANNQNVQNVMDSGGILERNNDMSTLSGMENSDSGSSRKFKKKNKSKNVDYDNEINNTGNINSLQEASYTEPPVQNMYNNIDNNNTMYNQGVQDSLGNNGEYYVRKNRVGSFLKFLAVVLAMGALAGSAIKSWTDTRVPHYNDLGTDISSYSADWAKFLFYFALYFGACVLMCGFLFAMGEIIKLLQRIADNQENNMYMK